ncbi:MAG TPA: MarR family transcriptional regulator [Spirochaetota bacterium]
MKKETVRDFRRSLRLLEREFEVALSAETKCCEITIPQCHAMLELEISGEISLSDLAVRLDLDKSTLSRTVESLVRDDLAIRTTDGGDRRAVKIKLSEKGIQKVKSINVLCDRYYGDLFQSIPASMHASVIESIDVLAKAMNDYRNGESCCKTGGSDE